MNNARSSQVKRWVIVPAAGIGSRMQAEIPKQYLQLGDKTLLEHTLERLLQIPQLEQIVVPLHPQDPYWSQLTLAKHPKIKAVTGGHERSESVLNGLAALDAASEDWVLVHDAARPCVSLACIERLFERLRENPVGGILGVPVADTLKRVADGSEIKETVDRNTLWQAQTPQMMRFGLLQDALQRALAAGCAITDEASAVEFAGYTPLIVEGRRDNIKITRPEDLAMAGLILELQNGES